MYSLTNRRYLAIAEVTLIVLFAFIPLFITLPYRLNIFLSWDGAYRISQGEIPYKDFGLPLGYGYWIVPALFFKLFGPAMITLIKAQVFINIISGLAFLSILKSLRIQPVIRLISVLLYVISYSFFNFWPWYNHTVIVYEFISLALLFRYLLPRSNNHAGIYWILLSAGFMFLSFFTKQDGGGLGLLLAIALLIYYSFLHKQVKALLLFIAAYLITALLFILPVLPYHFGYWFNHGQPPHNSRLSMNDFVSDLMGHSQWLKFYLVIFTLLLSPYFRNFRSFLINERMMFLTLTVCGICVEAFIFQFTSYTPPDNNIFYHSFAFVFILTLLYEQRILEIKKTGSIVLLSCLVLFWWSDVYWRYIERKVTKIFPEKTNTTGENVISRETYLINTDTNKINIPQSAWVSSPVPAFRQLTMPVSTVDGINRLLANAAVKSAAANNRILNMTELTPLSYVMGFKTERGSDYPLWYHLGVGMFNKQKDMYLKKINSDYYDAVLYEYIPALNNFYPFEIRDALRQHYQFIDSFLAPRSPTNGTIEVYIKRTKQ